MSEYHDSLVEERRGWTRFEKEADSDEAVIVHPECGEILAEVHDESLGGLAVILSDDVIPFFPINAQVDVIYCREFFPAYVRHVERQPAGGYLVGLACERESLV